MSQCHLEPRVKLVPKFVFTLCIADYIHARNDHEDVQDLGVPFCSALINSHKRLHFYHPAQRDATVPATVVR